MTDEDIWRQLEAEPPAGPSGRVRRRLATLGGSRGVFAAIEHPLGRRMLLIELDREPAFQPAAAAGITVDLDDAAMRPAVRITLADNEFEDLFTAFVTDLTEVAAGDPDDTATVVRERVARWMRFLERTRGASMSALAQRGLWGELHVLRHVIAPLWGADRAVAAWRGPARAVQDFQLGDIALEVKTTISGKDQRMRISSERQLDDSVLSVLVLTQLTVDMRPEAGETLNAAVDAARRLTEADLDARSALEEGLLLAGYLDAHRDHYGAFGYTMRELRHYRVKDGFPRIIESDVTTGVGRVGYDISASACEPFSIDEGLLTSLLEGRLGERA